MKPSAARKKILPHFTADSSPHLIPEVMPAQPVVATHHRTARAACGRPGHAPSPRPGPHAALGGASRLLKPGRPPAPGLLHLQALLTQGPGHP